MTRNPSTLTMRPPRHTIFGGLAASGWHTCSALMRMNVDGLLTQSTCLAGVGVEENRWLAPVRPATASRPRPGRWKNSICGLVQTPESSNSPPRCAIRLARKFWRRSNFDPVRTPRAPRRTAGSRAPSRQNRRKKPADLWRGSTILRRRCRLITPERGSAPMPIWANAFFRRFHKILCGKIRSPAVPYRRGGGQGPYARRHVRAGWQTASCWMRNFIRLAAKGTGAKRASLASPGFADLVWRKPVLVGDTIGFSTQIVAKRDDLQTGRGTGAEPQPRRQSARRGRSGVRQHGVFAHSA